MADDLIGTKYRPQNAFFGGFGGSKSGVGGGGVGGGGGGGQQRRRHSITVATNIGQTAEFKAVTSGQAAPRQRRRQSIQESLQSFTKSMSTSLQKAINFGGSTASLHDEGKSRLNKAFFKGLLSGHFNQPDLKVTKLSLRPVPNPHTNQILHEAEVWIKDSRGRRKIDLLIKYSGRERATSNGGGAGAGPGNAAAAAAAASAQANENQLHEQLASSVERLTTSSPSPNAPATSSGTSSGVTSPNNGWVLDGTNDEMERETKAYAEVIHDMWQYLRKDKGIAEPEQYLCLPQRFFSSTVADSKGAGGGLSASQPMSSNTLSDVIENHEDPNSPNGQQSSSSSTYPRYEDILVLQDLFAAGYHSAAHDRMDESGLDFNHSIMAISRLARFHAVSYAMRNERGIDMAKVYPFLAEDPVYRPDTKELFSRSQASISTRLFNIFQQCPTQKLKNKSAFFLDAVRNLHAIQSEFVRTSPAFGVLCHGDLWRQNVLFFYGSSLECQTDCLDVKFEDLHRVRFASCVTDILYFLFTTVDYDVRRDHMMDFLGVYHDHFSKTVHRLCPEVSIFSREQLFSEFTSHILFGFLEGICLFSTVYESQLHKVEEEERTNSSGDSLEGLAGASVRPRYSDYREAVLAMIRDVVKVKFKDEQEGR